MSGLTFRRSLTLLVLALLIGTAGALAAHAMTVDTAAHVLTASVFYPVVTRPLDELARMASARGAGSRTIRHPYYDTQSYAAAGQNQLSFFGAINPDKGLSNARGNGGVLPAGYYFEPITMGCDILSQVSTSAGVVAGALNDVALITNVARGFARITLGDIAFPEIPIRFLHQSGGPMGIINGTYTAPIDLQQGVNGVQDGGYCLAGSFVLGPGVPLGVTLNWTTVQAISVTTFVSVWFDGNWTIPTG